MIIMKITVINGTEIKGCTYQIKESFLGPLRGHNEITEFYLPRDLPYFCCGCKNCFLKSELLCPHAEYTMPIWNAMLEADLLVFVTPVYALRVSAQMKCLLDHFCVHWMVHRPDERMFGKRAVILTDAIGIFQRGAQRDLATSLMWLGVSDVKKLGIGLLEGIFWEKLSDRRRKAITDRTERLARSCAAAGRAHKGPRFRLLFAAMKIMHQKIADGENPLSADNRYWADKGWIKDRSPEAEKTAS